MDGLHHATHGLNSGPPTHTYPSPNAPSPQQIHSASPLPPLQPSTGTMQPMYGSHPHTPRTPGTPNTPNSAANISNYQQTSQAAARGGIYSMASNGYPAPYGSSNMMPQTTGPGSHPQAIAPAPIGGPRPPVLRPMPPGGLMNSNSLYSSPLMAANYISNEPDHPTHVVGSQGRRGILPSAPGRPAAPAAGSGNAKNTVIPVKDAEGKFPCPHCTKTYLHAKHLKRHLLRRRSLLSPPSRLELTRFW